MKSNHLRACVLALAAISCAASAQPVTSWELSGEFNLSNNSNTGGQVWTYGRQVSPSASAVANFGMLSTGPFIGPMQGWKSGTNWAPAIYQNPSSSVYQLGPANVPIHGVVLLPGFSCERAAVRFTPPTGGSYRISGQFWAANYSTSSLDSSVHVRKISGGVPSTIYTGVISTPNQVQRSFTSKYIGLTTNDRIDFEVGCGPSGSFPWGLMTGIHAVVERVGDLNP